MKFVKPEILLCVMGGTIDSFVTARGEVTIAKKSYIHQFITNAINPYLDIVERNVALKDSRQITNQDRLRLLKTIKLYRPSKKLSRKLVLITHGTFTLSETALFLHQRADELTDYTIVLMGSFWPLNVWQVVQSNEITGSDAGFNLGFAIAALLYENPGIYVAMNGRVFTADQVKKDLKRDVFISSK